MERTGVDYIPRKTFLSEIELEAMHRFGGMKAYGFMCLLENRITRPGSGGYYLKINHQSTYVAIAQDFKCDTSYVRNFIRYLLDTNYFDKTKFIQHGILTNYTIQNNVIINVYGKSIKRDFGELRKEYILESIITKMEKNAKFRHIFEGKNTNFEEIRQNKKKLTNKERDTSNTTTPEPQNTVSLDAIKKLSMFREKFPNIPIGSASLQIPDFVDIDLLISKYDESPQWLQIAKNLSLAWACKPENYKKIIADNYKIKTGITCKLERDIQKHKSTIELKRHFDASDGAELFDDISGIEP